MQALNLPTTLLRDGYRLALKFASGIEGAWALPSSKNRQLLFGVLGIALANLVGWLHGSAWTVLLKQQDASAADRVVDVLLALLVDVFAHHSDALGVVADRSEGVHRHDHADRGQQAATGAVPHEAASPEHFADESERVAAANAFLLKAELAKGEAEHGH